MKLKNIIKSSLFVTSSNLAKSFPSKIGLMILFDISFLVSIFGLQKLLQYFAQSLFLPKTLTSAYIFIIFSLIYYLIILFAYSFFKYSILGFIKFLFDMRDFSFKRLWQFYSLNIIISGIFFAIMLVINSILISIKQPYQPYVFIFFAIPYLLFLYTIINTSHPLFYEGASIKDAIKKSFEITFTKIKIYREIILTVVLFALLLWVLFLGSGYLIRLIAVSNYAFYLKAYSYFKQASIIIFYLIFYLIILINRISFYAVIKTNK